MTAPIVIGNRPITEARRFTLESDGFPDPKSGDRIGEYVHFALENSSFELRPTFALENVVQYTL